MGPPHSASRRRGDDDDGWRRAGSRHLGMNAASAACGFAGVSPWASVKSDKTSRRRTPMKALLSKAVGGPETLVLEDLPSPSAKPGFAVVDVKACGVNYP